VSIKVCVFQHHTEYETACWCVSHIITITI
jgi:hypothetical protein